MKDIYNKLLNEQGSKRLKKSGTVAVTTNIVKDSHSVTIVTAYEFIGSSNIYKETMNLMTNKRKYTLLSKIEITRVIGEKMVSFAMRFLGDDGAIIHEESDVTLASRTDTSVLKSIKLEII